MRDRPAEEISRESKDSQPGEASWLGFPPNARRLRDFRRLCDLPGGFSEKSRRNNATKIYALAAPNPNGKPTCELAPLVKEMARGCHPQLSPFLRLTTLSKYSWAMAGRRMTDQTISEVDLSVTRSESQKPRGAASRGGFRQPTISPDRNCPAAAATCCKRTSGNDPRAIIAEEMERVPSVREMETLLQERGIRRNHQTICKDSQSLGIGRRKTLFPVCKIR